MPDALSGRHRIHYTDTGSGYSVLFGHSLTFDGTMFEVQTAVLSKKFRCISIDFRGHGKSSKLDEPYTLDDNAADVLAVADAVGAKRFHYVGLSMGGMTGMRVALRAPDRVTALALLDTSAGEEDPAKRTAYSDYAKQSRDKPPMPPMIEMTLGLMFSPAFMKREPAVTDRYRKILLSNDVNAISQATLAVTNRESILGRIGSIKCPVLVIVGSQDIATPPAQARAIASSIPNAALEVIEGAGHMTPVEAPGEVTPLLLEFLGG